MPPNLTPVPGSTKFFNSLPNLHHSAGTGFMDWPALFDRCDLKTLITWHGADPRMRDALNRYLKDRYGEDPDFFHPIDHTTFWWGKVLYFRGKPQNIPASLSRIPINRIKFIVSKDNDSVFLLDEKEGSVHVHDRNTCGELGGHTDNVAIPTEMILPRGIKILDIFSFLELTFFVTTDRAVFFCFEGTRTLKEIPALRGYEIIQIASFYDFDRKKFFFMTKDGRVHFNLNGSDRWDRSITLSEYWDRCQLAKISLPTDSKALQIVCAESYILILTESGQVFARGSNRCGQLGLGHMMEVQDFTKIPFQSNIKIIRIFSGSERTYLVTNDKRLLVCGRNDYEQLGVGHARKAQDFTEIPFFNGAEILNIIFLDYASVFVTDRGTFMCGTNKTHENLMCVSARVSTPQEILLPDNAKILKAAGDGSRLFCVSHDKIFLSDNSFLRPSTLIASKAESFNPGNFEAQNFDMQHKRFMQGLPICWWKSDGNMFSLQPTDDSNYQPVNFDASFFYAAIARLDPVAFTTLLNSIEQRELLPQAQGFLAEATDGRYISRAATYQSVNNFRWILNYSPKHLTFTEDFCSNIINSGLAPNVSAFLDFIESNPAQRNLLSNTLKKNPELLDYAKSKLPASIYHRLLLLR